MIGIDTALFRAAMQVTLFSLALVPAYYAARRLGARAAVSTLLWGMSLALGLTLLAASPWPIWQIADWQQTTEVISQSDTALTIQSDELKPNNLVPAQVEASSFNLRSFATSFAQAMTEVPQAEATYTWSWRQSLLSLVVGGVGLSLTRLAWGMASVARLKRACPPVNDPRVTRLAQQVAASVGLGQAAELCESPGTVTPATVGWLRPAVLLPSAWRDWSDEELSAVLAHEMAHIAGRDYLGWVVARMTVAMHFYNPLVRWLAGRLQLEQELAADAAAARALGDSQAYLRTLASLALATPPSRVVGPARTLFPSRSLLMRRVEMLRSPLRTIQHRAARTNLGRLGGVLLAVAAMAVAGLRAPSHALAQTEPPVGEGDHLQEIEFVAVLPIPLSLVTNDAVLVTSVCPGYLQPLPVADDLLDNANKLVPFLRGTGVGLEDIAEIMTIKQDGRRPRMVLRFYEEQPCGRFLASRQKQGGLEAVAESNPSQWRGLSENISQLDDTTLVVDYFAGAYEPRLLDNAPPKWADAWKKAAGRPVALAANVQTLAQNASWSDRNDAMDAFTLQPMGKIAERTEWLVGSIGLEDQLAIDLLAECQSPEIAKQGADMVQALMTLGRGALAQQRADAIEQLANGNAPDGTQAKSTLPIAEKMFDLADDFLTNAKPIADGATIRLSHGTKELTPQDLATMAQMVLMPALQASAQAAKRSQSMNNLMMLGLALHNFEATHGRLPRAVAYEYYDTQSLTWKTSKHPHSWRITLLPYLDQQDLYDAYRFDQPWDSPANLKIANTPVEVMRDPNADAAGNHASYFVLIGPDTAFPRERATLFSNFTDGLSNTLAIVEAKRDIPWTKPEDIPFVKEGPLPKLGGHYSTYFVVTMADGSAHVISNDLDPETLRGLITRNGKESIRFP